MDSIALAIVAGALILAYVVGHELRRMNQTIAVLLASFVTAFVNEHEYHFIDEDRLDQLNFLDCLRCMVEHVREIRDSLNVK